MRAFCILIVLLATVSEAKPAPRMIPPIERNCLQESAWDKIKACIERYEPGSKVTPMSDELRQVGTTSGRQYMFVRIADLWRMVYQPGDETYELVGASNFEVNKRSARRIDLSHHVALGNTGSFVERISLVCWATEGGCLAFTTACTVMDRGRAVETFRGELREVDGTLTMVGDRSHALGNCRGR